MEAEIGVMLPRVEEHLGPRKAGRVKETDSSQGLPEGM